MESKNKLNSFFVDCFYSILRAEERVLSNLSQRKLSLKEIHVIDAVFCERKVHRNSFSNIAKTLGITLGTLTTSFNRLERKGYLMKKRDETDKRIFYIDLTPLGELINEEHLRFHDTIVDQITKRLDQKELDCLTKALDILNKYFNAL
ncbi:MAG: MarR family transcriptional regulator [Erysipelotrichaceae bacterium]|jgi:DNA-binding MarR family transcriptional regulator|nr:MarR family transcriptional regulator [Erysipelotrichaceae bacterium]